ncbi:hypothetical protein OU426_16750 [Frigidibacter sp. RF13]|uniref:hypothetical protein n=1 Tax=Frigidibacter sp. RF13 TaxID=2997340 RepID=UPI0022721A6C|nr:hypothetical protein [Frigidibacter sp. RF13]MCY1128514.1 hypothetical protein [Frigidibacter sp. RF13]
MIGKWFRSQSYLAQIVRAVLILAFCSALLTGRWSLAFVSLAAYVLTLLPELAGRRFGIRLPLRFVGAIALFVFATIFLGEALDFYNRLWWWDIALHGGSAVGFGLVGFLFVFMLFEGDRYAAPAWAVAFTGFCLAVTIGVLWEIFEFAMDQLFGLNMQKSGLVDTMWDLILDTFGASLGAFAGFLYLKGRSLGGLTEALREFIRDNRRLFRKAFRRKP